MSIQLETPWAAAVALAALVPVAAWLLGTRRSGSIRRAIGLAAPPRRESLWAVGALVLAIVLLALAAAQPMIAARHRSTVRRDADVFVVLDTSRSMLASPAPGTPTRFARAIVIARALHEAIPTAAVGIASMTDRVLPHLFPTQNGADFELTLRDAIAVQHPPPAEVTRANGTDLGSLGDLALARFFPAGPQRRIAVVLTDGESRPFAVEHVAAQLRRARIRTVLIRIGTTSERVWSSGGSESYRPRRRTGVEFARTAALLGGSAFEERDANSAIRAVTVAAGAEPVRRTDEASSLRSLAPFFAFASLLPIAFLLWRRNLARDTTGCPALEP